MNSKGWQFPKYNLTEFRQKNTKYCVCIPIINEGEKIKKQLVKMKPYSKLVDILILDGGSTDGSTKKRFLKSQGVRSLLVKTEPGRQGSQLRMGFEYALKQGYDGVVTIDGNSKDGTEAVPEFIKYLSLGYDLVLGSRFKKGGYHKNTPTSRLIGVRLIASPMLSLAAKRWYTDVTNGFRAYSKKYLLHPQVQPLRHKFIAYEMVMYLTVRASQVGLKTTEIPVKRVYPKGKVPTKMTGWSHQRKFLVTQLKVALGHYNP